MCNAVVIRLAAFLLTVTMAWAAPGGTVWAQEVEAPEAPQIEFDTNFDTGPGGEEVPTGVLVALGAIGIVVLVIAIAILLVVCYLLYTCFKRIPQQYRLMEPGMVFLLLIPCVNLVWIFFVTSRLSRSFQAYFAAHPGANVGDCGQQIGLWWSICYALQIIPFVNYLAGPAALVLAIIYLVKVLGLKNQIPEGAMA